MSVIAYVSFLTVLFKINVMDIAIGKFECDAPRAIDMYNVAGRVEAT